MSRLTTAQVLEVICASGEMTRRELAEKLRSNEQTVRHHLRCLQQHGLITVTRTTLTRSSPLKWYGRPRITWHDNATSMAERLRMIAEAELHRLLNEWVDWCVHRMPNKILEDVDKRIHELAEDERIALTISHGGLSVWRFGRVKINQGNAYRSAIASLMSD